MAVWFCESIRRPRRFLPQGSKRVSNRSRSKIGIATIPRRVTSGSCAAEQLLTGSCRHCCATTRTNRNCSFVNCNFTRAVTAQPHVVSSGWVSLGPAPLASDATGNGSQDYRQVSGRATAIAIDPADTTGNTVYIGGALAGVWKSTNAASTNPANVTWTPVLDYAGTLAVGAIAIQPGNGDPSKSVILVGTGESNSSADSYYGLGLLRSEDGGQSGA